VPFLEAPVHGELGHDMLHGVRNVADEDASGALAAVRSNRLGDAFGGVLMLSDGAADALLTCSHQFAAARQQHAFEKPQ